MLVNSELANHLSSKSVVILLSSAGVFKKQKYHTFPDQAWVTSNSLPQEIVDVTQGASVFP